MKIGYRIWIIVKRNDGIWLSSLGLPYIWQPGENVSYCDTPYLHPKGEKVPAENCKCGFYAKKDIKDTEFAQLVRFLPPNCHKTNANCLYSKPSACHCNLKPIPLFLLPEKHAIAETKAIGYAFGAVMLYGKIKEGELGYQAEKAEIHALFGNYTVPCFSLELTEKYGVPMVQNKELPDFKTFRKMVYKDQMYLVDLL